MNEKSCAYQMRFAQLVYVAIIFASGCGSDDEPEASENDPLESETDACDADDLRIVLDEEHNYSLSNQVDIQTYELKQYPSIPTFDWSQVTRDTLGHPVDPTEDVGHVEVVAWNIKDYNYEMFEGWLNIDTVDLEYLGSAVNVDRELLEAGVTSASLDQFVSLGAEVDPQQYFKEDGRFPSDEYIFVLIIGRGKELGYNAIMASFIRPVDSPDAPEYLALTNDSVSLEYQVSLNQNAYPVPKGQPDIEIDWRDMNGKTNALGQELTYNQVGKVMLTFYAGKTIPQLQKEFLDLEIIADRKYEHEPEFPKPLPLSSLVDENGTQFGGFGDEDGTWLLSLWCTVGCNNPAPKYMTALAPCD